VIHLRQGEGRAGLDRARGGKGAGGQGELALALGRTFFLFAKFQEMGSEG